MKEMPAWVVPALLAVVASQCLGFKPKEAVAYTAAFLGLGLLDRIAGKLDDLYDLLSEPDDEGE